MRKSPSLLVTNPTMIEPAGFSRFATIQSYSWRVEWEFVWKILHLGVVASLVFAFAQSPLQHTRRRSRS